MRVKIILCNFSGLFWLTTGEKGAVGHTYMHIFFYKQKIQIINREQKQNHNGSFFYCGFAITKFTLVNRLHLARYFNASLELVPYYFDTNCDSVNYMSTVILYRRGS